MTDTIALFASARRDGNTGKLMDWIGRELNIEIIDLLEKDIAPYDYEHRNMDDDFIGLVQHLLEHEKIIFASPIYWYAVSAQMKIFIDRLSDLLAVGELKESGRKLRGRTGYVVCTSINDEADPSFINAFRNTFAYLGMRYGGHLHANCNDGYRPENHTEQVSAFVRLVGRR